MQISELIKTTPIDRLETEILLAYVLQTPRTYLHTHPEHEISASEYYQFQILVERRLKGEPIAYITGKREFWSMELTVTPDTLIPRPETELLVETVLETLPSEKTLAILELGTGSGAIAVALAKERPNWSFTATDISPKALVTAKKNAELHKLNNINFYESDWYQALPKQRYHAIVSNPPYIDSNDPHLKQGDLRFEPQAALSSGHEGLDALRIIIQQAPNYLFSKSWIFLEHGYNQSNMVQSLLSDNAFSAIKTLLDFNQLPRVTTAQYSK